MVSDVVRLWSVDPGGCCVGIAYIEEVRDIAGEANSLRIVTRFSQISIVGEGAKAFEPRTGDGNAIPEREPEGESLEADR